MLFYNYFKKVPFIAFFIFQACVFVFAQTANLPPAPREEKLLNGMKLLVWNEPKAEKVTVKLRIHSGSAFDPQGKEGVMALLAEILFPNESVKEFFAEDLGGSLEVESSYDYIQINATGNTDQILPILEALATAVSNPQIDKETLAKIRPARLEKVKELEKDPSYIADQAAAKRLFGDFPYGRPQTGTTESLNKIDFADLILARQRFLTADNTTIAVSGNVKHDFIFRAARRYFGGWTKADKKVPATFRQPDAPNAEILSVVSPVEHIQGVRYAFRGLARNDENYFASEIFVNVLHNRLINDASWKISYARQEARILPGFIIIGFTKSMADQANVQVKSSTVKPLSDHLAKPISEEEFAKAKAAVLNEINKKSVEDMWLDVDTYKLVPVKNELQKANNITLADVQNVAGKLSKNPMVTISLDPPPANVGPKINY